MLRVAVPGLVVLFGLIRLNGQGPAGSEEAVRIGPGITPPRLLHKVEPEYSLDARADHIQGTVVLQLTVDEKGRATGVTVISPLGYGLDERAQRAVETWQFSPGRKGGKPVKVLASVDVNFRFPELWFDEKAEHQRSAYNMAIQTLIRGDAGAGGIEAAVKSLQDLSAQHYPPAMCMIGIWKFGGEHVEKDPSDGLALIQSAAAKNYGPALYEIAIRQIEGRDVPKNIEQGLDLMREASVLGSPKAQFYLGSIYESGNGVPREPERARRYFRLCAARGTPVCQYRLGKLLLNVPDRPERDYVQAIAWLQLAGRYIPEAQQIAQQEAANLTSEQTTWMATLKPQLAHK